MRKMGCAEYAEDEEYSPMSVVAEGDKCGPANSLNKSRISLIPQNSFASGTFH